MMDDKLYDTSSPSGRYYKESLSVFEEMVLMFKRYVIQRNDACDENSTHEKYLSQGDQFWICS